MIAAVSGFIELVGSMIKGFQNTIIIHQPLTILSSFKELAQTLTSKLTFIYQLVCIHLLAIILFSEPDNGQQIGLYELVYVGYRRQVSLKLDELWGGWWMIIVFLICSMNPETAVTFHHDHFNQVVFVLALCDRNRILYKHMHHHTLSQL